MTDIGIEPKAVQVATFQRITGIADVALAEHYLETDWQSVEYLATIYGVDSNGMGHVLARRIRTPRGVTTVTVPARASKS